MRTPPPVKPPSAILNMNRGFSAFSSRRPLDRGSSRGGPGRSSRSPFTSSATADGAELTPQESLLPGPKTTLCSVLAPGTATHPGPRHLVPKTPPPLPIPSGTQMSGPSTHYLSCPNPPSPPPASPCVPVHPSASPPPSLLASTPWLWEGVGDRKEECHPQPLTPGRGNPQILSPPSPLRPCTHLTSLCPHGTQVQAPSLQVPLAPHPLEESSLAPAAPQVMGLGWGYQPK